MVEGYTNHKTHHKLSAGTCMYVSQRTCIEYSTLYYTEVEYSILSIWFSVKTLSASLSLSLSLDSSLSLLLFGDSSLELREVKFILDVRGTVVTAITLVASPVAATLATRTPAKGSPAAAPPGRVLEVEVGVEGLLDTSRGLGLFNNLLERGGGREGGREKGGEGGREGERRGGGGREGERREGRGKEGRQRKRGKGGREKGKEGR